MTWPSRANHGTFVTVLLSLLVVAAGALWSALEWPGLPWVLGALVGLSVTASARAWAQSKYEVEDINELLETQDEP